MEHKLLKIGLALDNYKVPAFKKALLDKKYEITYEGKFTKETTFISFSAPKSDIDYLTQLFKKLNIDVQRNN